MVVFYTSVLAFRDAFFFFLGVYYSKMSVLVLSKKTCFDLESNFFKGLLFEIS